MTKLQIIYCVSQLVYVLNLTLLFMWLIIDHPVLRSPQQWFILQLFCLHLESWCKHSVYSKKKKKKKRWIFFSCGSHVKPQVFFKIKFFPVFQTMVLLEDCIFLLPMRFLLLCFHATTPVSSNVIWGNCAAVCFIVC